MAGLPWSGSWFGIPPNLPGKPAIIQARKLAKHELRWRSFLLEAELRQAVLDACSCLAGLFGVTDCIITSDYNPAIQAFREGSTFDEALVKAGSEHGERPSIASLYIETPENYVIREVGGAIEHLDWDIGRPAPEGWERASNWDSNGYWRFQPDGGFNTTPLDFVPFPNPVRNLEESLLDEHKWDASKSPNEMFETILRLNGTSLRKLQLWSCACLRRILPLLVTEKCRRPIEVMERFIEGRAHRNELVEAARGAENVRKGSQIARRAICEASRMFTAGLSFPPSNISEAAAAAVDESTGVTSFGLVEREKQASLLRDILGNPFRPVTLDPRWLTSNVIDLAQAIYQERAFEKMPILADALMDAGCDSDEMLKHCRCDSLHVRGCWVVDLLIGKQ